MRIILDSSDEASSSSDIEHLTSFPLQAATRGRSYGVSIVDSSDSSDDEVERQLVQRAGRKARAVTESPKQTRFFSPVKATPVTPSRKPAPQAASSTSRRPRLSDVHVHESPRSLREKARWELLGADEHAAWMKDVEQESMTAGNQATLERVAEIRRAQAAIERRLADHEAARVAAARTKFKEQLRAVQADYARKKQVDASRRRDRSARLSQVVDASIVEATRRLAEMKVREEAEERAKKEQAEREEKEREERASKEKEDAEAEKKRAEEDEARRREEQAKAQEERERLDKAESEARAKADEAERANEARAAAAGSTAREWRAWADKQAWIKAHVIEVVKADGALSAAVRKPSRLITRKVGQVVNTRSDVLRVANDVAEILNAHLPAPPSPASPTALDAVPAPHAYLLSHLAKALIKQAEGEVAAKADAAFPLGRIAIILLVRGHAAFADVLVARLVKKCPWVIPFFPQQGPGQSKDDYFKTIGRKPNEPLAEYIDRSAAILTLYFAILQTPIQSIWPSAFEAPTLKPSMLPTLVPAPLRFPAAWTWFAHATREPIYRTPLASRLFSLFLAFLGPEYQRTYGKQAVKAVQMLGRAVHDDKVAANAPAEAARLRLALDEWAKMGRFEPLKAREWEAA
ncbi:Nuclear pore complex nucleoporin component [Cryptotrichosporon argae]